MKPPLDPTAAAAAAAADVHVDAVPRLPPYRILPPDVWSECLSYLDPHDLSGTVDTLPFGTEKATRAAAEEAARLSIAFTVEVAEALWKDSAYRREDAVALELDAIVAEDTSILGDLLSGGGGNGDGDGRHPPSPVLGLVKGETWQGLYRFLHAILVVCELKIWRPDRGRLEFEHDHSFDDDDDDDDDDSIPRESRIHPGCISHDREAIAFAVGFVLGAPRAVLWSSRRGKLFSVAAACSEIDNTELPAARIQMLAFRLAREGFWRHASLVLRQSLVIPHRNDDVVCDEMAPSIDGMILLSTVLIDGLSHGDFCYETIVEAVQYGKKAVVMAEEYHNKTRNRGAARAIAPTGSCLIPSQLKTRRGKGSREPRRRSTVPPPSATESLFPPDALLLVRAKLALGKALSVFAVLTGRNCINLRMLTERGVVPVPLSDDGGDGVNRPHHSPLDPLVAEDDPMWRDLLLNPEVREHIQWSEQFFQEAHRHLREGMAVCETETERHRRCEPPYADAESDGGVRRESGGDDDAVSIVRGAFLCAFGAWNLQRVTLSVFYRKRLETERYTLRSLADFCDAFRCLTEGALASASRTASTNRPDGGGPRRRYRAAAGENLKTSTGAVVTAVDTLLACGEDMGEVFRYCRQCEVGALDSLSSEFCGGGFASESAGGAEAHRLRTGLVVLAFAELLSVRERGSFHRRRLRFDAFLDKVRSPAALRRRYGAVKAWLVVVAESTREGGDERCAGAPGERGAR